MRGKWYVVMTGAAGKMAERRIAGSAFMSRGILWIMLWQEKEGFFSFLLPCIGVNLNLVDLLVRCQC